MWVPCGTLPCPCGSGVCLPSWRQPWSIIMPQCFFFYGLGIFVLLRHVLEFTALCKIFELSPDVLETIIWDGNIRNPMCYTHHWQCSWWCSLSHLFEIWKSRPHTAEMLNHSSEWDRCLLSPTVFLLLSVKVTTHFFFQFSLEMAHEDNVSLICGDMFGQLRILLALFTLV